MTLIERLAEIYRLHDKWVAAETDLELSGVEGELIALIEEQKVLWGDPNAAPLNPKAGTAATCD